jgi:RNA polymerase sigma factor (sigma-70 family)
MLFGYRGCPLPGRLLKTFTDLRQTCFRTFARRSVYGDVMHKTTDSAPPAGSARGQALLETHLELIQRQLAQLSRRSGLPDLEAEEFRSWALFKLVDDEYRILASWEGRSTFPTFLKVVLVNLLRDYRIHIWGKWRPSAASRRHGEEAVLLEQLMIRDGLTGAEALARLRIERGVTLPAEATDRLAGVLPWRQRHRQVGDEELLQIPVDGQVENRIEEQELARIVSRLCEQLLPLLRALPAEDRLLLRAHFLEGLSIATLAPILGRPQRELYAARDRCLKKIRLALSTMGLELEQMADLIGRLQEDLGLAEQLGA